MASVNKVILLGNLGRDPETKNFDNGGSVCSFTMATTESYWDKEKAIRVDLPTEWHNIRINRPGLIKVAQQYLHKGSQVYIEGSLRTRQYQPKEGGEMKYFTEVFVNELILTGGKPNGETSSSAPHAEMPAPVPVAVGEDDLPF